MHALPRMRGGKGPKRQGVSFLGLGILESRASLERAASSRLPRKRLDPSHPVSLCCRGLRRGRSGGRRIRSPRAQCLTVNRGVHQAHRHRLSRCSYSQNNVVYPRSKVQARLRLAAEGAVDASADFFQRSALFAHVPGKRVEKPNESDLTGQAIRLEEYLAGKANVSARLINSVNLVRLRPWH